MLAQLVEMPVDASRGAVRRARATSTSATGRGFALAQVAGGYRFQTHPDMAPYVERFVLDGQTARLSGPALETLAIIAYKQPISRAQLSAIRGVNVEATLQHAGAARLRRRDRPRPGPGQRDALRHHARVPRAAGPRLARRPAAARRLRARARRSSRRSSAACTLDVDDADAAARRPTRPTGDATMPTS